MGRTVDVDDLIDAGEVAELVGLSGRKSLAAMRSQNAGYWQAFPPPVIDRVPCKFWVRQDVEHWQAERPPGRRSGGRASPGNR